MSLAAAYVRYFCQLHTVQVVRGGAGARVAAQEVSAVAAVLAMVVVESKACLLRITDQLRAVDQIQQLLQADVEVCTAEEGVVCQPQAKRTMQLRQRA